MKVDEQFKCKDCDNYNLCKYYHNRLETSFICKEFQNQWGFIKELEAIKAEICQRCNDALFGSVSGIVDKHISELKGENKQ